MTTTITHKSQYRRYNSRDQRVRNTASQELMQRGFKEGARGQSDFWVNYHVTKRQTQKISGQEQGMGLRPALTDPVSIGYSSGQSVKTYEDGTAVFDVIDIRTGKIGVRVPPHVTIRAGTSLPTSGTADHYRLVHVLLSVWAELSVCSDRRANFDLINIVTAINRSCPGVKTQCQFEPWPEAGT